MTEIKHHTIHANNIRQHYVEAGEGVPVVLLHGFPETSYAWRHQIPELAKKYRVIAPDLRGYGETDKQVQGTTSATWLETCANSCGRSKSQRSRWSGMIGGPVSRRASPKIIQMRLTASGAHYRA